MATHRVRVGSIAEAVREQQRREAEMRRAIEAAHLDSAHATERKVVADVDHLGLVDTGLYKSSWEVREGTRGVELRNDAPYAGVIEKGSRPFFPPLQPLIEWAERKAGDLGLYDMGNRGTFPGRASLTGQHRRAARRVAYAIARKFAREGYRPRYVMRSRLPYLKRALDRAMREYVDRVAGRGRL